MSEISAGLNWYPDGIAVWPRPRVIVSRRKESEASARNDGALSELPIPPSPLRPWQAAQLPR